MTYHPGQLALQELRFALEQLLGHPIPGGTNMTETVEELRAVTAELAMLRAEHAAAEVKASPPLFGDVPITIDPNLPPNRVEFRGPDGRVLGTINVNDDTVTVDPGEGG